MESKNVAYLDRLDHIRFFAAAMVVLFHTYLDFNANPSIGHDPIRIPMIDQGHTGVPLFMVISGMILAIIVHGKEIMIASFYKNRALRIYPLYIFIVTLGYFATPDARPTSVGVDYVMSLLPISNLYRLQYGMFGGQLWSVAVELQFYLIFPFIMTFRTRYGARYLLGCIGLLLLLRLGAYRINHNVHGLSFFSLFGNLDSFLIGILTGEAYLACRGKHLWWSNKVVILGYVIGLNVLIHLLHRNPNSRVWVYWPTLQAVLWAGFVMAYMFSDLKLPGAALWSRFGKYSYSIYIWHIFVLKLIPKSLAESMTPYTVGIFVVLPVTLLISAVSYHLLEEPFFAFRVRYTKDPETIPIRESARLAA